MRVSLLLVSRRCSVAPRGHVACKFSFFPTIQRSRQVYDGNVEFGIFATDNGVFKWLAVGVLDVALRDEVWLRRLGIECFLVTMGILFPEYLNLG